MDGKCLALFFLTALRKHESPTSLEAGVRGGVWDRERKTEAKRDLLQDDRATQERGCGLGAGGTAPLFLVGLARKLQPGLSEPPFLGGPQSLGSRRFRELGKANQCSMAGASKQQEGGTRQ